MVQHTNPSRRTFIKSAAYAGLTLPLIGPRLVRAQPASEKIMHVSFGIGGMPWMDTGAFRSHKAYNLYAFCDVDENQYVHAKKEFPDAKVYSDFRELFDKEHKNFDSCNVGTPDHMHAPIGLVAMSLGKHVYGQKPLAHEVYECRQMTEAARKAKVMTQMGIQIHSSTEYRMAAALIQLGVIGKVKEVHSFSNKQWGGGVTPAAQEIPATLHWDLWCGVAPMAPYAPGVYHPGNWRRFLDYGTGTFGDMGCHIYDPVYKALALTAPIKVTSKGAPPTETGWPNEAEVEYIYPKTPYTDGETVKVTWYDGGRHKNVAPAVKEALGDVGVPGQGSVFIGTKGTMLLPHIGGPQPLPRTLLEGIEVPKLPPQNHWHQFLDAVKGGPKPSANFDYAGGLTEAILAGGIATRFPNETLDWDAASLKFTNKPEANQYVRREYRKEFAINGLA